MKIFFEDAFLFLLYYATTLKVVGSFMKRYAMLIQVKPEKLEEYKILHRAVWPEVLAALSRHHVRNYSIYLKDNFLFGYLEYHGENYQADMAKVAEDEATQRWWTLTDPCQEAIATRASGEWWASMEEVFHLD